MMSLVIPVYKNAENIAPLLMALAALDASLASELEVVFVVDGSPDDSYLRLSTLLPRTALRWQLLLLSRNFGSFAAIRAGLEAGTGDVFAVMAADLQEPPELIETFDALLRSGEIDVAVGQRVGRSDPLMTRLFSGLFWKLNRRLVLPELPEGGVDVFGCTREVRDQLLCLDESHSSLVGLLFWVGFRRAFVPYERRARAIGKSAWTLRKKLTYLADSVFSFTDLPIRILTVMGMVGLGLSLLLSLLVVVVKQMHDFPVPGYAATLLTITFFGALNCFGLGVIGSYVWRAFENTKRRPGYIVASHDAYDPRAALREGSMIQ